MEDLLPPKVGTTSDFELKKDVLCIVYINLTLYISQFWLYFSQQTCNWEKNKKVKIVSLYEACEKLFVHYSWSN